MKRSLLLLLLLVACPRLDSNAAATAPDRDAGPLPQVHIDVEPASGEAFGLQVELALTDASRERGLMFRKDLPEGTGMLFIFAQAEPHTFWMKNTLIPLDMVFAEASGLVLGCVARAEPMTTSPRRVAGDSKYVLELPGGSCALHHIGPGAHLIVGAASAYQVQ